MHKYALEGKTPRSIAISQANLRRMSANPAFQKLLCGKRILLNKRIPFGLNGRKPRSIKISPENLQKMAANPAFQRIMMYGKKALVIQNGRAVPAAHQIVPKEPKQKWSSQVQKLIS